MKRLDGFEPRQAQRLARDDHHQRQHREAGEDQADIAEALAAVEQVLHQIGNAEPEAERHQPAERDPEQRRPAEALAGRRQHVLDRHRQRGGLGLRRDAHPAADRMRGVVAGIGHHDAGIVEPECRGLAVMDG